MTPGRCARESPDDPGWPRPTCNVRLWGETIMQFGDWDAHAEWWADRLHGGYLKEPRGAFADGPVVVIFGNDGYRVEDGEARKEVRVLRARLKALGIAVEGFAVRGWTWAMIVKHDRPADLERMVWGHGTRRAGG
jgi:hypothetical protein